MRGHTLLTLWCRTLRECCHMSPMSNLPVVDVSPRHQSWPQAECFLFSFTCRAVTRNNKKYEAACGENPMTQSAAKDLRNEHTFEHLPSYKRGEQCVQVLFADLPLQQLTFLKDAAKTKLKCKPLDTELLD